ncbi:MAG TPA: prepilin-type N-terminal cleavage/methylation domain-containing protein [Chthonomonadaceae bacterium]|nr:prepilin-type N-terminal cleavage/methylation domain-containing protein [Chthonomonadaceae bacterium]
MTTRQLKCAPRAFTLIELLVVIAIIAILAAILFPTFAMAREQARQSSTMSHMHDVWVGASIFNEDEGHWPYTLLGYVETPDTRPIPPTHPANRPALGCVPAGSACAGPLTADAPLTNMQQVTGTYSTNVFTAFESVNRGFVYGEQVKPYISFTCPDNIGKQLSDFTMAYWPLNSPVSLANGGTAANPIPVVWTPSGVGGACPTNGDHDLPSAAYAGAVKLYYKMDSMDIGPMLDQNGNIVYQPDGITPKYELHYSPDWSHTIGAACDKDGSGNPYITELKYRNPPADRTIFTYVTQHTDTAKSNQVIILLLNGTARKIDKKTAGQQLPLAYVP